MSVLNWVWGQLDVTTVFIFLMVFLVGYYWLTTPSNLPPGPTPLPMIGNLISVGKAMKQHKFLALLSEWRQRYGDVFTVWFGAHPIVLISDYKNLQDAFVKHGDIFSGRVQNLYLVKKLIKLTGLGVIGSQGQQWKELRRLTLSSLRDFGLGKKSLEERVQDEARAVVEVIEKGQGQPMELKALLSKFSSNIICSVMFGKRFEYSDHVFAELTGLINDLVQNPGFLGPTNFLPFMRFWPPEAKSVREIMEGSQYLDNYLKNLVKDRKDTFDPNHIKDFVDIYYKAQAEEGSDHLYDAANMRRVILDLFIAGTETTSTTMDWLILYMVAHPDVQTRCQQEIDKVVASDRMVTTGDRKQLAYIEAVITEVSRLVTIVPLALSHVATADGKIGGYNVPKGTIVMVNLMEIHRDPKNWPDPLTFDPTRFLDKDGQFKQPKDNYAPFSIGPRICLGESLARMEMFLLFCTLLQTFTFSMGQGQTPDLEGHFGVTYSAKTQAVIAKRRIE